MPKIDAPTVAEHRSRRRRALVAAGAELLARQGLDAVTLAAVGSVTGLARSSVYQYFDSTPALIAAIVEEALPEATDQLRAAVSQAATPREQIDGYLCRALDLACDPGHRSLYALAGADLPAECRTRVAELHEDLNAPLLQAVAALGVTEPDLTARLLFGVLQAAVQAIIEGAPKATVERRTLALIHDGLAGLTR